MKRFCRQCGAELFPSRRKFCSASCAQKYKYSTNPDTIPYHFKLFKNIVAASETVEEFNEYWKKYFRGDKE